MKKTFEFGKVDYNGSGRKNCLVTVEVELKEKGGKPTFSACANVWNPRKTDIYMGGQCLDTIWSDFRSQLTDRNLFMKIYRLWKLYHLNDMNAGTQEQKQLLDAYFKDPDNRYDYTKACDYLKSVGMYEVEHEGEPYKYGHGWIYYPIPDDDLAIIHSILDDVPVEA